MTTTLEPQFLRALVLMGDFKPGEMRGVKARLLALAVTGAEFTAADLPAEISNGDIHIAGAACGALVSENLITAVGRVKSPDPRAKGRKLNVYRIACGRLTAAMAWFKAQGLTPPKMDDGGQMNLIAA